MTVTQSTTLPNAWIKMAENQVTLAVRAAKNVRIGDLRNAMLMFQEVLGEGVLPEDPSTMDGYVHAVGTYLLNLSTQAWSLGEHQMKHAMKLVNNIVDPKILQTSMSLAQAFLELSVALDEAVMRVDEVTDG